MFKKILAGYTTLFISTLRITVLLCVCIGTGFLIVYPLWKLADSKPDVYTIVFSIIIFLFLSIFAGIRIRIAYLRDSRLFFLAISRKLTLLAGFIGSIALVLIYQRLAAGLVVLFTLCLYGYLAFVLTPSSKNPKK